MCESLDEYTWLYRGVPVESPEVADVRACGEVSPPRPDRVGEHWRHLHSAGLTTDTGYTSWSTDRSIAEAAAGASAEDEGLSGRIRIFRVAVRTLDPDRVFEGRADEDEYLIEGTVENVEFYDGPEDDDHE